MFPTAPKENPCSVPREHRYRDIRWYRDTRRFRDTRRYRDPRRAPRTPARRDSGSYRPNRLRVCLLRPRHHKSGFGSSRSEPDRAGANRGTACEWWPGKRGQRGDPSASRLAGSPAAIPAAALGAGSCRLALRCRRFRRGAPTPLPGGGPHEGDAAVLPVRWGGSGATAGQPGLRGLSALSRGHRGASMASLAAQDSYLQGLARRVCAQHGPEPRKRKFGNGTIVSRPVSPRGRFGGVRAWGGFARAIDVVSFFKKK